MGLIKEPLEIDFIVDSKPLTKKEELAISAFIKADKEKSALLGKKTVAKSINRTKAMDKAVMV